MRSTFKIFLLTSFLAVTSNSAFANKIYNETCSVCHASGVANAPIFGDKKAWAPRIAKGKAALYLSAIKGKGVMPAKGGNTSASDADIKAVVDYMVAKAGG